MNVLVDLILPLAVITATLAGLAGILSWLMVPDPGKHRREMRVRVKAALALKLDSDIPMTSQDVIDVGRGLGTSPSIATDAIYELFAESENKEVFSKVRHLIDDLQREEPFESLPEEAKPSLARIATLCENSQQTTDKALLHPIVKVLDEYQEMKREHAGLKRQGRISYVIALVSFFIGVVGLILAFSGPSRSYISDEVQGSTQTIMKELKVQHSSPSNSEATAPIPSR
jgi:hypothetical protein